MTLDFEDEIVRETTVAREGEVIHPRIRDAGRAGKLRLGRFHKVAVRPAGVDEDA